MLRRARRVTPSRTARVAAVSVVTRCGVSVVVKYLEALLLCVSPHAIAVGRSPPPPRPTLNPKPSTARPPHTCFARTLASPHAVAVGRACRAAAALPLPVLLTVERLIASRGAGGAAARAGRGGAGHHVRSCAGAALELHNARDNTVWSTCVHANVAIASPAWKLVAVAHLQIPSRWQRQRKMLAWPGARVARCLVAAQCGGRAAGATAARAGLHASHICAHPLPGMAHTHTNTHINTHGRTYTSYRCIHIHTHTYIYIYTYIGASLPRPHAQTHPRAQPAP